MSTVNQKRSKSTDLGDHLAKRPRKDTVAAAVRRVRQRLLKQRESRAAYRGGLIAEKQAAEVIRRREEASARSEVRALILGRKGRRISLQSLLRQSRADGKPRWALVNPHHEIGESNGSYDADGDCIIRGRSANGSGTFVRVPVGHKKHRVKPATTFPPLPPEVRELARDPKILGRAEWIGVLYQPEQWEELPEKTPDPALIVKWRGVEGYYALAVWGGDRPGIMEFVD